MGYYTQFTLTVDSMGKEIDDYLQSLDNEDYNLKALEPYNEDSWGMNSKWYSDTEDMCKLSAVFPDVLFTLDGSGEEVGDIWRKWFKNGSLYASWSVDIKIPPSPESWRV